MSSVIQCKRVNTLSTQLIASYPQKKEKLSAKGSQILEMNPSEEARVQNNKKGLGLNMHIFQNQSVCELVKIIKGYYFLKQPY